MQKSIQFEPFHDVTLMQLADQLGVSKVRYRTGVVQALVERAAVYMAPQVEVIAQAVAECRARHKDLKDASVQEIIYAALLEYQKGAAK